MSKASPFPWPQNNPARTPGRVVRQLDCQPGEAPVVEVAGFQIKSDVPPPVGRRYGAKIRAALEALEVGQYFDVPGDPRKTRATMYRVAASIAGREFTAKELDSGMRIWRIA